MSVADATTVFIIDDDAGVREVNQGFGGVGGPARCVLRHARKSSCQASGEAAPVAWCWT